MKAITRICKCCGKEFKAQETSSHFCSVKCRHFYNENEKRKQENRAISEQVKETTRLSLQNKSYFSITDAAKFLCVSRNTLYRIIASGGIRPLRFSARTIRISSEDLERYVPIDLTSETTDEEARARLEKMSNSRPKKRKPNKTPKVNAASQNSREQTLQRAIAKPQPIEEDTHTDIEEPSTEDLSGWYTYSQLVRQCGISSGAVKDFCKWHNIPRKLIGMQTFISKPHWDKARGNDIDLTKYYSTKELVNKYKLEKHYMLTILLKKDVAKIKIGTFAYFEKEGADKALRYRLDGMRANTI